MAIKTETLSLRLQDQTGCSPKRADALVKRYCRLVAQQVLLHLSKSTGNDQCVHVSVDDIKKNLGDIIVRGQRYYALNELQKFKERLFTPILIGNNIIKELTMAQLNYDLEEILIAAGDSKELVEMLYKPFEHDDIDSIPIDLFSLNSFIKGNQDIDRADPKNANKIQKINNYLYHALRIKLIAEAFGGVMPHVVNESKFGRKYYKGPSLQTVPKRVRHAALGACFEYDIESSVFAWKYSWFKNICREQNEPVPMPATLEYLDHKRAIRRQVANAVFGTDKTWAVDIIKQAITAIGFGAPARVAGYKRDGYYEPTALNEIITSQTRLQTFLNFPWVREFVQEQKSINTIIVEYSKISGLEPTFRTIPELLDRAGRLKPNSIVSYLYQHSEREILEYLIAACEPSEILLTVHDCIYTRRPIDLLEVRVGLKQFGDYYDISSETHQRWAYDDNLQQHLQRMAQEESLAQGIKITVAEKKQEEYEYQQRESVKDSWDGSGYNDAQDNYDADRDPFLADLSQEELLEYRQARQHVLKESSELPDWYKQN